MTTQKNKTIFSVFGILSGYLLFLYCAFMIIVDISMGKNLKVSIFSYSFLLALASLALAFGIIHNFQSEKKNLKKFLFSFLLSSMILMTVLGTTVGIAIAKSQAASAELPLLLIFVLPAILIYSLFDSAISIISRFSYVYIFIFNLCLSFIILISVFNHFWLFHWFAIALGLNLIIVYLKSPSRN